MFHPVQADTPVMHKAPSRWHAFVRNTHVRNEFNALLFALMAVATTLAGLHIAPVVFSVLAVLLVCGDIYGCFHKDR